MKSWQSFSTKDQIVNIFDFANHVISVATAQLPLFCKSSCGWYLCKWTWQCSNKTLFSKTGSQPDFVHRSWFALDHCFVFFSPQFKIIIFLLVLKPCHSKRTSQFSMGILCFSCLDDCPKNQSTIGIIVTCFVFLLVQERNNLIKSCRLKKN